TLEYGSGFLLNHNFLERYLYIVFICISLMPPSLNIKIEIGEAMLVRSYFQGHLVSDSNSLVSLQQVKKNTDFISVFFFTYSAG
ncbi:hypothetical protein KC872_01465, partial [Candidatus Kaiserbacteria bacterium]|nr:hypothetical protein [Candidatus Kaiserbacteria bacterium]